MKKLLAILLALVLVLVNVAVLAEEEPANLLKENKMTETYNNKDDDTDVNNGKDVGTKTAPFSIKLSKIYAVNEAEGVTPVVPDHTVVFTVEADGIEQNPAATSPDPDLTIDPVEIKNGQGTMTINLPSYTAIGVYKYTITETNKDKLENGTTVAGVQYPTETYNLVVTVVQGEGLAMGGIDAKGLIVAGVALRKGDATEKLSQIDNEYKAGSLTVSKKVTGNMGDLTKDFDITVTFTIAEGTTVYSDIACSGDGLVDGAAPATITEDWTKEKIVKITLKAGQSVTFDNIPAGVGYAIAEDDYTAEAKGGYDTAVYDEYKSGTIADAAVKTEVTNNKNIVIDTGITMETVPYIVILALALIGAAVLFVRRREEY